MDFCHVNIASTYCPVSNYLWKHDSHPLVTWRVTLATLLETL
jgi:hypothetical protein